MPKNNAPAARTRSTTGKKGKLQNLTTSQPNSEVSTAAERRNKATTTSKIKIPTQKSTTEKGSKPQNPSAATNGNKALAATPKTPNLVDKKLTTEEGSKPQNPSAATNGNKALATTSKTPNSKVDEKPTTKEGSKPHNPSAATNGNKTLAATSKTPNSKVDKKPTTKEGSKPQNPSAATNGNKALAATSKTPNSKVDKKPTTKEGSKSQNPSAATNGDKTLTAASKAKILNPNEANKPTAGKNPPAAAAELKPDTSLRTISQPSPKAADTAAKEDKTSATASRIRLFSPKKSDPEKDSKLQNHAAPAQVLKLDTNPLATSQNAPRVSAVNSQALAEISKTSASEPFTPFANITQDATYRISKAFTIASATANKSINNNWADLVREIAEFRTIYEALGQDAKDACTEENASEIAFKERIDSLFKRKNTATSCYNTLIMKCDMFNKQYNLHHSAQSFFNENKKLSAQSTSKDSSSSKINGPKNADPGLIKYDNLTCIIAEYKNTFAALERTQVQIKVNPF